MAPSCLMPSIPAACETILAAIGSTEAAVDHGEAPLLRGPSARTISPSCGRRTRTGARPGGRAMPPPMPGRWCAAGRSALDRIDARLGQYSFDASSPIAEGTWEGAYLGGPDRADRASTPCWRATAPPSRSAARPAIIAGADYLGGYCYLNNAAIAAEAAVAAGRRVAILDIDYHHGNGTQDIFYARGDVLFVSIHADPVTDYPFFWGHADETGERRGRRARTSTCRCRSGTALAAYLPALDRALERIAAFAPDLLVCSLRRRHLCRRPDLASSGSRRGDYPVLARRIAALGVPTLMVMEGGYAVDALGANLAAFLSGFLGYLRWSLFSARIDPCAAFV